MIFEFERRSAEGSWEPIGLSRTPGSRFDVEEAVVGLRAVRGGYLREGRYRVRVLGLEPKWLYGEVDDHGIFRRSELPDP